MVTGRNIRVVLVGAVVILLGAVWTGCTEDSPPSSSAASGKQAETSLTDRQMKYLKIETVKPSQQGVPLVINGRVALNEQRTAQVGTPVEGRVEKVLVQVGDRVKKGQALMVILSQSMTQVEAAERKAKSALSLAEKSLARAKRLFDEGAASQREVLESEDLVNQAKAEYQRAAADLKNLGGNPDTLVPEFFLRSPIEGVVVTRKVSLGDAVQPALGSLFTISDLTQVWVLGDIPERELAGVSPGLTVKVESQAYPGRVFEGIVLHLAEVLDPTTRTAKLRCLVPNQEQLLKPEMFVRLSLSRPGLGLLVPAKAVVTKGDRFLIYVQNEDQTFAPREVLLGSNMADQVTVLKGLSGGEQVVVEGALLLDSALGQVR